MAKKFKCPCGYEDDNEANFNYHQSWCSQEPRFAQNLSGHIFKLYPERPPMVNTLLEDVEVKRRFSINKLSKLMIALIMAFLLLLLIILLWGG